jgi:hypothetical protein
VPVPTQESEPVMYCLFVNGIDFASFYDFSIRFWNCSDSVVLFVFLLDFGIVPTVWYFLFYNNIIALPFGL